jgi:uncharacterized membrane protein
MYEAFIMKIKPLEEDVWVGGLFFFICVFLYFVIVPREVQGEIQRGLAPDFFPKLSVWWVGIFSLFILAKRLVSDEKDHRPEESSIERRAGRKGALFTVLGSILYLILCCLVSYVVSTILILVILTWVLGERRWYMIAVATLVTTFGIYFLFGSFMSVQLPEGILF